MAYQLSFEYRQGYLFIIMTGQESYDAAVQFWQDLSAKARAEQLTRFMIIDQVKGRLDTSEHFYISTLVARLFAGKVIAYVDPKAETFENNQFGETVVTNRGVVAKVFHTETEAEVWLNHRLAVGQIDPEAE